MVLWVCLAAPAGARALRHTYEVKNLADFPGHWLVVYPAVCDPDGGTVAGADLSQNPQLRHLRDYEVLRPGQRYEIHEHCADVIFYALPRARYAAVEKADGEEAPRPSASAPALLLQKLEALTINQRPTFFRKNARRSSLRLLPLSPGIVGTAALREVHEEIAIEALDRRRLLLRSERAVYLYEDGSREAQDYVGGLRVPPSRTVAAGGAAGGGAAGAAGVGGGPPTAPTAPTAAAPQQGPHALTAAEIDRLEPLRNRWAVILALLTALLVGGALGWQGARGRREDPEAEP